MTVPIPLLIITGPVGVGKTSVASAIAELLDQTGVPHALVDMDMLRWCHPSPSEDPFHMALGLRNLAVVWENYQAVGAQRLILVDVVEAREDLAGYAAAVPGAAIVVVRLHAEVATIWRRLEGREAGESLAWHQQRAVELVAQMGETQVEDLLVDTEGKTITDIAREVLQRRGWVGLAAIKEG